MLKLIFELKIINKKNKENNKIINWVNIIYNIKSPVNSIDIDTNI